jgi:citrate lyase gamma subunit
VTTREAEVAARPAVRLEDGKIVVEGLVIDDRDVVEYFAAVEDLAVAILEALRVGVRVLRIAATSGDVEMVKREFDAMTIAVQGNVDKLLQGAEGTLAERLNKFTTEDLKKSLDGHREELNGQLVRLFGPESANSVQRQIDKLLEDQAKLYKQGLAAVLEQTDDPENPLAKLREELKGKASEAVEEIRKLRDKVLEIVGQEKGVAAEREKGTAKGRTYQELVFECVSDIARHFGDTALYVADQTGLKGQSKAGDVVVEINPQESSNSSLQIAFEAKNQAGVSIPRLLKELEEAKENRAAASAVAVFSSGSIVPAGVGQWRDYPRRRFVCVLDSEAAEPIMLEFTYRCARFEALRAIAPVERRLDVGAIRGVIQSIRTRVGVLQQMKTKLTGASSAIDEVQRLIDDHREGVRHDLEEFDRLLATGGENSGEESS